MLSYIKIFTWQLLLTSEKLISFWKQIGTIFVNDQVQLVLSVSLGRVWTKKERDYLAFFNFKKTQDFVVHD